MNAIQQVYATSDKEKFPSYDPETQKKRTSTTFAADFLVCDFTYPGDEKRRIAGIKDTYKSAFDGWKSDYKYMTEMELVFNHLGWHYYHAEGENSPTAKLYFGLSEKVQNYIYDTFGNDQEAMDFHYRVTD